MFISINPKVFVGLKSRAILKTLVIRQMPEKSGSDFCKEITGVIIIHGAFRILHVRII